MVAFHALRRFAFHVSARATGCSKCPASKAAVSEEASHTYVPYVERLSDARTTLAGGFNILLRVEDLDKNSCASRSIRLSHDVFNMLFDRLLCDLKGIRDFFIGPSLCQMLDN